MRAPTCIAAFSRCLVEPEGVQLAGALRDDAGVAPRGSSRGGYGAEYWRRVHGNEHLPWIGFYVVGAIGAFALEATLSSVGVL